MLATSSSTKVYGSAQNAQGVKPLPPPRTQKELESRVQLAKMIREEAKAEAESIRQQGKAEANNLRQSAQQHGLNAQQHGQNAQQAQKGIEACDDTIKQAQERNAKREAQNERFAALMAKKQAENSQALPPQRKGT